MNRTSDCALILDTALTQTIAWGTAFIPCLLMVQPMEAALGPSRAEINGAFTLGIHTSGAPAIPVRRWVDRHGGRALPAWGTVLGAAMLAVGLSQLNEDGGQEVRGGSGNSDSPTRGFPG